MLIRLAELKDAQDILSWRNDSLTRAMSRNDELIDEQGHEAWFERVLKNRQIILLVGVIDRPIGMVRFDRVNRTKNWEISVALASKERGKGLGRQLLNLALSHFFDIVPEVVLLAEIKQINDVSRRLFESVGFQHESSDGEMLQFTLSRL